ncbi:MAG: hypothetical protein NTZ48_00600, partial [Candidatus Omnitrophica bacterium]|nr:hypothetical protein [Candidatus Omnitrophota bacterium]
MKFKKVRKLLFILLLVFLCLVFILELRSNKVETIINRISMQVEAKKGWDKFSLVFKVNFLDIIPGARMYLNCSGLTQYEGNTVYPLELKAEAIPPISIIKKASAEMFSYTDSAELVPHSFKTRTNMDGEVKEENEIVYNQK